MDYKEKYKEALERARQFIEHPLQEDSANIVEYIFPELAEGEDERIRKEMLIVFKQLDEGTTICGRNYDYAKWIAWLEEHGEQPTDKIEPTPAWSEEDEGMLKWLCRIIHSQRILKVITLKEESELGEWMDKWLNHNPQTKQREIDDAYLQGICDAKQEIEKQGEPKTDCPQNHKDINHPNGCIVKADFNGGEGFYKVNLDYLNKKQVDEIEEMIRVWNKEISNYDNIKYCVSMCLADAPEQRFKDYNTTLKDCIDWSEKQGKKLNADEVVEWMRVKAPKWLYDMVYPICLDVDAEDLIKQFKKDFGI